MKENIKAIILFLLSSILIVLSIITILQGHKELSSPVSFDGNREIGKRNDIIYTIIVENIQKRNIKIFVVDTQNQQQKLNKYSTSSEKDKFTFKSRSSFKGKVTISENNDQSKILKEEPVTLSINNNSVKIEIDEPPIQPLVHEYYWIIEYNQNYNWNIAIDGVNKGQLKSYKNKKHKTTQNQIKVTLEDPKGKRIDSSHIFKFSTNGETSNWKFKDTPFKKKYTVVISNPNNINATIKINNSSPIPLGATYTSSSNSKKKITFEIRAHLYPSVRYSTNFNANSDFNRTYSPKRLPLSISISGTPAGGDVKIPGINYSSKSKPGKTTITKLNNIVIGKKYTISINHPNYENWERTFIFDKKQNIALVFAGGKIEGTVIFEPEIDNSVLNNSVIKIDGVKVDSANRLDKIPPGNHVLEFYYKNNNFEQKVSKNFVITKMSSSTPLNIDLNINFIKIDSNKPKAKIYVDKKYAGKTPCVLPFFNTSMNNIKIVAPNLEPFETNINPKKINKLIHIFPNQKAQEKLISALDLLADYSITENSNLLNTAKSYLDESLHADNDYVKPLIPMSYIYSIWISNSSNKSEALKLLNKLDDFRARILDMTSSTEDVCLLYKNLGMAHFKYAENFLFDSQKVNYLKNKAIGNLAIFREKKKLLKTIDSTDRSFRFQLDEGSYYLAVAYQTIYKETKDQDFKNKALLQWNSNDCNFPPYISSSGVVVANPFKELKKIWIQSL